MNNKLEIDIDLLKTHKLGLEAYLILYCLINNNERLINEYIINCKKIPTEVFNKLRDEGYISYNTKDGNITFRLLSVTEKGKSLYIGKPSSPNVTSQFEDFRKHYPNSVRIPGRTVPRRLHGDLARCRKLYSNLMMETTHEILCQAADMYYNEKLHSNSLQYMQDLATWLHQKNYQQYLEDIKKSANFTNKPTNFTDDI